MSDIADYLKNLPLETVRINGTDRLCPAGPRVLTDAINRLVAAPDLSAGEEYALPKYLLQLLDIYLLRSIFENRFDEPALLVDALQRLNRRFRPAIRERGMYLGVMVNLAVFLKSERKSFEFFCAELVPRHTQHQALLFNIACVGASHGMIECALDALSKASDHYYPLQEIETDSDLEPLRAHAAYRGIVAQRRYLDAKESDFGMLLSTLETLAACRFLTRKGADVISHRAADFLYRQELDPEQIRLLIRVWLEHAVHLPFLPEEHNYFALVSLRTLAAMNDSDLTDRIIASLIHRDKLGGYEAFDAAESTASLGRTEIAYELFCRAMAGEVSLSNLDGERSDSKSALSRLYRENECFRTVADRREAEKNALKNYLLEEPDPNDFTAVFQAAQVEFSHFLSYRRKERLTVLARFRDCPERERIAPFLRSGFDDLRHRRLKRDDLVDNVLFDALVCTIADFQDPGFIPQLINEFIFVTDDETQEEDGIPRNYELNQVAGTIAVALSALGYEGSTAFMEPFLESYEWRYRGEDFIMKTRYGKWMVEKDGDAVCAWLSNSLNSKGTAWAIAALADLGAGQALPVIRERLYSITNPVVLEVYKEGIARLERGCAGVIPWNERMVRLFGVISRMEMANGSDSDNVFLSRAIAVMGNPLLALVVEADDDGA